MNIFHSHKNCTDRRCPVHWLRNTADAMEQVSQDIRELNRLHPIKPRTTLRQDFDEVSQKTSRLADRVDSLAKEFEHDKDRRTLRQILDNIEGNIDKMTEVISK